MGAETDVKRWKRGEELYKRKDVCRCTNCLINIFGTEELIRAVWLVGKRNGLPKDLRAILVRKLNYKQKVFKWSVDNRHVTSS